MSAMVNQDSDSGLILAAEECPPEKFEEYHSFSDFDKIIIRKLSAHGPVLLRGGRGSGKSALLLEAHRGMRENGSVFSVYMSLRHLPLLQSDGPEYVGHFCSLLSVAIAKELGARGCSVEFSVAENEVALQASLSELAQALGKRIVILFDDAAHIGREKPLEVFFDLFRTLSSNTTSFKASIYPGVTKFGTRFDVFNDSTVIDISRSDVSGHDQYFSEVIIRRHPTLANKDFFSESLTPEKFARLLGRAVVGNMRAFILACNRFENEPQISVPVITKCFVNMAEDYYWPLMEEVSPKLGVYEPLIEPARDVFEAIISLLSRNIKNPDRVIIHRSLVGKYSKIFEILEYLGFIAKREASRGMKSGGRGPVYAINLCNLLDRIPNQRLTIEMIEAWVEATPDLAEIHSTASTLEKVELPSLAPEDKLGILGKPVALLAKSRAYPYGLTDDKIRRLESSGITTIQQLTGTTDTRLKSIDGIGDANVKRIRDVTAQAIWM